MAHVPASDAHVLAEEEVNWESVVLAGRGGEESQVLADNVGI